MHHTIALGFAFIDLTTWVRPSYMCMRYPMIHIPTIQLYDWLKLGSEADGCFLTTFTLCCNRYNMRTKGEEVKTSGNVDGLPSVLDTGIRMRRIWNGTGWMTIGYRVYVLSWDIGSIRMIGYKGMLICLFVDRPINENGIELRNLVTCIHVHVHWHWRCYWPMGS